MEWNVCWSVWEKGWILTFTILISLILCSNYFMHELLEAIAAELWTITSPLLAQLQRLFSWPWLFFFTCFLQSHSFHVSYAFPRRSCTSFVFQNSTVSPPLGSLLSIFLKLYSLRYFSKVFFPCVYPRTHQRKPQRNIFIVLSLKGINVRVAPLYFNPTHPAFNFSPMAGNILLWAVSYNWRNRQKKNSYWLVGTAIETGDSRPADNA